MQPMTVLAPLGMLGYGIPARSMERGLARDPAVLALDAGSTDPGPYYLGAGVPFVNRRAAKRDLTMILDAAHQRRIPVLIGSAGGGGGRPHVEWTLDLYRELCRERGYRFRTAVIDAEVDRGWLRSQVAGGRVRPLDHDRALTATEVDAATRIVAQMGVEPFLAALEAGAEVVIAGRACDAAVIAAFPIRAGFDSGLALHMGKILECGGAAAYPRHGSDSLLGVIEDDAFTVEPPNPDKVCTVASVAAHSLYERANPYELHLPHGHIDLKATRFEASGDRAVRVSGTRFVPAVTPTLKLEGVARVGFRTLSIAGVREPQLIANLDAYLANVRTRVADTYPDGYRLMFHVYGRDGVMGPSEPQRATPAHELCLVVEAVAPRWEDAEVICALGTRNLFYARLPEVRGTAGTAALMMDEVLRGKPGFEWTVNHVLPLADPLELTTVKLEVVGR